MGRAHGLDGYVVVTPETDDPARFVPGAIFIGPAGEPLTVARARTNKEGRLLIRFEEVADRSAAEAICGVALLIDEGDRRQLSPDEFWPDQLVGLEARDSEGTRLGTIVAVVEGSAQHRLRVDTGEDIAEVPFVRELVPEVSVEAGYVTIRPIPGLFTRP